ncbi:MAG: hypothetical protein AB1458_08125 [Bacteroidota bacterium]
MKRLILLCGALLFCASASFSQGTDEETNCYLKWAKKFEERGGEEVPDGTYDDVIITIRQGTKAECYYGKVEVVKGKITQMWLKQDGGTYEVLDKKYKITNEMKIVNGMSTTLVTVDDELVNVIFYKKLKPKKPGYQKAPEPKDD